MAANVLKILFFHTQIFEKISDCNHSHIHLLCMKYVVEQGGIISERYVN